MPDVRITLFGALEIVHGTLPPQRPPTQRVLSLLGYLVAHHDVPQSRDKLVDLLWPDLLPRQGRRVLSDTLWRTRRLLTPPGAEDTAILVVTGDTVMFHADATTWVDTIAFDQLVQSTLTTHDPQPQLGTAVDNAERLAEAMELYRGEFLEECYDDWALYERERLRELYLSVLQRLLAYHQELRAYEPALQVALRLVNADPLREEAHRELMRLYYLMGREVDALRVFERCRTVLDQELGIDPDPETLSLYEEISALQQRRMQEHIQVGGTPEVVVSTSGPSLREIPFVGYQTRRSELMEAVEQAMNGGGGSVLLAGEAGMGKSRLLREVAGGAEWRGAQVSWGYAREDAQAVPFGPLCEALSGALTPLRARQVCDEVSEQVLHTLIPLLPHLTSMLPEIALLGPQTSERPSASLHAAIISVVQALGRITPQVIILEDVHWFDPASLEALTVLLPNLRTARVLIILSGRSDELPQRSVVWDALLRFDRSGPFQRVDLDGLNETDCANLVQRALRLRQLAPRFSARLYRATGGNPFFILETLRALQEQKLLTRDAQGVWHTPWDTPDSDYDDLPLPQNLRDVIGNRLRELAPHERAALAAAAVLGQSFAPTTWAGMTTSYPAPGSASSVASSATSATSPSLAAMVRNQLLQRQFLVEDSTGYRFGHETMREVIYDTLDEPARQLLHLRAAETLEREHFARVEALAQHLYLAGAWHKAVPYLVQAADQARSVHALQDAHRCYNQAFEAAIHAGLETTDLPLLSNIQLKRGQVATSLGDYTTALTAFNEVLRLSERDETMPNAAERRGSRRIAQVQALNGLSYVYGLRNDYAHAAEAIQQAMVRAAESPRLIDRAEVFYQAGTISLRMNDYAQARQFLNEAIRLYDELGIENERAKCLVRIGFSYLRQDGPTDQVIDYFSQALTLYQHQSDRFAEHSCLVDIAGVYLMCGRLMEVVQAVGQSLEFFSSIKALDDVAACLFLRGEALRRMGRLEEAIHSLHESLAICTRLNRTAAAEFNYVRISETLRDMGRYEEALRTVEQTLQTDDRMIKARGLLVAADVWRIIQKLDRAWDNLVAGHHLTLSIGSKVYTGIAYRLLAQLRIADGGRRLPRPSDVLPDIEASFLESLRLLQEAHCADELALSYMAYGEYLITAQRQGEAKTVLTQAQTLMWSCGMAGSLEAVQTLLQPLQTTTAALQPGQRRVTLARHGTPRGRPLRADELVEIIWTVDEAHQVAAGRATNKMTARQERLRRLCAEAAAQGAEPTVGDLADALGVATRTVHRDIVAMRAAGEVLITRGVAE